MRKIHENKPVLMEPRPWEVVETAFSAATNKNNETLFSLANGYIGMRGYFEEGFYGAPEDTDPAVMLNGVYEYYPYRHIWCRPGFPERFHAIVGQVDPVCVRLEIGGEPVKLGPRATDYRRTLDMRTGLLTRTFTYTAAGGQRARLTYTRFVSAADRHALGVRVRVEAETDCEITIRTSLSLPNGAAGSKKEEIGSDMASPFSGGTLRRSGGATFSAYSTKQSGFSVCCAAADRCTLARDKNEDGDTVLTNVFSGAVAAGETAELSRLAAFDSSGEGGDLMPVSAERIASLQKAGFDALREQSAAVWRKFWERSDIEIEGDDLVQQGIRFAMFMINQSAGKDGKTNIAANGLTGTGYSGHTFWDTEIFMLPMFLYAHPETARNLLLYRYRLLPKAKERARQMDDRGALYAWNSINGEECGHVFEAVTAQYHIDNDIFYAIYRYYEATGDWDFMAEAGIEMLLETSKCLAHRGSFIPLKGGKFCINVVCGPDEYNPIVDNNCYTNWLTRKQLYFTLEMAEKLAEKDAARWAELAARCEVDEAELALWKRAADEMYLPYSEELGIYMQDDNFAYKDPIDVESIPKEKLPLLTHLHPLNLWRYQVCKQADLVLLTFLCGNEFTQEMKRKIFDYYEPKTIHDSSLSAGIHSIVACDIGYADEAYGYLLQAARMDLDNVNGNTFFGVHAACMGSCWMMIVNGYGGLRIYDGILHFKPYLPPNWKRYRFRLIFRGQVLETEVTAEGARYTLLSGDALTLRHREELVTLTAREPRFTGAMEEV